MTERSETTVAAAVGRLTVATNEFTAAVTGLRRRQSLTIVLLVLMVMGTGIAGYAAYQIRSCTVEGGGCYEKNRAQTGVVVGQIIGGNRAANVTIGECVVAADGDVARYRACIKAKGLLPE